MEKPVFVYLVVLEEDKTSVTSASFDQFRAQRLCHYFARESELPHAVVKEPLSSLPKHLMNALCMKHSHFFNEFSSFFPNVKF